MKIKCLRKLAEGETSANGRNYYLTAAMVVEDGKKFVFYSVFIFFQNTKRNV